MTLLEQAETPTLLEDATVSPQAVRGCAERLTEFLARYLPLFQRQEQRGPARVAIAGRLSGLERKTSEPIARAAHQPRRNLQRFVGAGAWDDEAVMAEGRRHGREAFADPRGVQRQWCGRLGKKENCQVGVFLAYAAAQGPAPLDRRLYRPQSWAQDKKRVSVR